MHESKLRNQINKNLQKRLINLREKKNVTQAVVSESTGISRTSIVAYEKGTSIPDLEKLYLLAEYYEVSCDYLLGRDVSDCHSIQFENMLKNLMDKQHNELLSLIKKEKLL